MKLKKYTQHVISLTPTNVHIQITISTPSRITPFQKCLGEAEGKLARTLAGGQAHSIVHAAMRMAAVQEEAFNYFLHRIDAECLALCQNPSSLFRHISVNDMSELKWDSLVEELQSKAPLLLKMLTTVALRADHKCPRRLQTAHHPAVVTAASALLKQRNREMNGIQSVVSLLMYTCHCDKQVCTDAHQLVPYMSWSRILGGPGMGHHMGNR
jgi:hypothetical protein